MRERTVALRILIADDEAPARRQLRRVLEAMPDVDLVGEAADGLEALRLIEALRPDLAILDIQMPGMSGTDVAANLPRPAPHVIFATAFDAHAIRAFELAAVDYLLKPWDSERMLLALDRARQMRGQVPGALPKLGRMMRLLVGQGDTRKVIAVDDIVSIQAQDNYLSLHTAGRDWLLREPLGTLLDRLQNPDLVRVHRSHAVNLLHVSEVRTVGSGDAEILCDDGSRLPCSRTWRASMMMRLEEAASQGE